MRKKSPQLPFILWANINAKGFRSTNDLQILCSFQNSKNNFF